MNELVVFNQAQDQEEFASAIVETKGENLPMEISEVIKVFEFTSMKAEAFRVIVNRTREYEEAQEAHDVALESGQKWGAAALYAEARIGKLLPSPEEIAKRRSEQYKGRPAMEQEGLKQRPEGINRHAASTARTIASNPDVVEQVIEEAKQEGDIPTQGAVLRKVKAAKQKEVKDRVEDHKRRYEISEEEQKYLDALDSAFLLISRAPPTLTDAGFGIVKKKLQRIKAKVEEILG